MANLFTRKCKKVIQKANQNEDEDIQQDHENSEPDGQDKFNDDVNKIQIRTTTKFQGFASSER